MASAVDKTPGATCSHDGDNHSDTLYKIYNGGPPFALCGYHVQQL